MTELQLPVSSSYPGPDYLSGVANVPVGKVGRYAHRINQNWRKTIEGIKYVCVDCSSAKGELSLTEKCELYESLPFKEAMFSKLAKIGEKTHLFDRLELLPLSISTLYLLAGLSKDQFDRAVAEGLVRPDVTRDEVEAWVRREKPVKIGTEGEEPKAISVNKARVPARLYCLIADEMPSPERHSECESQIVSWAKGRGMKAHTFTGENLASEFRDYLVSYELK